MAEYGIEPQIDGQGDVVYDTNTVTTPELSAMDIADDCTNRVNGSGLVDTATPSDAELQERHRELAQWAECLANEGVDLPAMISVEQFVAAGGEVWPFPGDDPIAGLDADEEDALEAVCPLP